MFYAKKSAFRVLVLLSFNAYTFSVLVFFTLLLFRFLSLFLCVPWTVQFFIRLGVSLLPFCSVCLYCLCLISFDISPWLLLLSRYVFFFLYFRLKMDADISESLFGFLYYHEQFAKWSFIFLMNSNSKFNQVSFRVFFFYFLHLLASDQDGILFRTDFDFNPNVYEPSQRQYFSYRWHFVCITCVCASVICNMVKWKKSLVWHFNLLTCSPSLVACDMHNFLFILNRFMYISTVLIQCFVIFQRFEF